VQKVKSKEYKRQRHLNAVLSASKVRGNAIAVLLYCCHHSSFDEPEITITKDQLCDNLRAGRRAIAEALADLRREGSLKAKRGLAGGRSVPVTYRLCIVGAGDRTATTAPAPKSRDQERETAFRAYSRKFGAVVALDMMEEWDKTH